MFSGTRDFTTISPPCPESFEVTIQHGSDRSRVCYLTAGVGVVANRAHFDVVGGGTITSDCVWVRPNVHPNRPIELLADDTQKVGIDNVLSGLRTCFELRNISAYFHAQQVVERRGVIEEARTVRALHEADDDDDSADDGDDDDDGDEHVSRMCAFPLCRNGVHPYVEYTVTCQEMACSVHPDVGHYACEAHGIPFYNSVSNTSEMPWCAHVV
jgi:hypothetical protein